MKEKIIRILFTSIGRRVELVQQFKSAAQTLGVKLEIYGADIADTAPALSFCDHSLQVPRIKDADYIPRLLEICQEESIDALIPTIDTDLLSLAMNKKAFYDIGTIVLVSAAEKITICRDKKLTASYFNSVGLMTPNPVDDYKKYSAGFPAFIKPKNGSSSIFAYKINNYEELESFARQVPEYIVQPFIEGTEYTVDVFCDLKGDPIYITPRIRLAVRAGEVLQTKIAQDEIIIGEIRKLLADFKPCGAITIQLIRQFETNEDYYIEINPRYGGGAPLTMKAGANSAMAILKILNGQNVDYAPNAAEDGAIYSRFDQSIRVNGSC